MEEVKILVFALVSFLSQEDIPIGAKSAEIEINRQAKQITLHQYDLYSLEQYREMANEGLDSLLRASSLNNDLSPILMTSKHFYEKDGRLNAILYLQYEDLKDLRKISFYADDEGNLSYPYMKEYEYGLTTGRIDDRYVRFDSSNDVKFTMQRKEYLFEGMFGLAEDWRALENKKYVDVSELFSKKDFQNLRKFIFKHGDRKTYRNFDNGNPHYRFDDFDMYLGTGDQRGIFDSRKIKVKEYTELVIHDGQYYTFYLASDEAFDKRQDNLEKGKVYWYNQNYKEDSNATAYLTRLRLLVD